MMYSRLETVQIAQEATSGQGISPIAAGENIEEKKKKKPLLPKTKIAEAIFSRSLTTAKPRGAGREERHQTGSTGQESGRGSSFRDSILQALAAGMVVH